MTINPPDARNLEILALQAQIESLEQLTPELIVKNQRLRDTLVQFGIQLPDPDIPDSETPHTSNPSHQGFPSSLAQALKSCAIRTTP
jgi:hypothetical protein